MSGQNPLLPDAVNCEHCIYCKPISDPMHIGKKMYQCRRNPPTPIAISGPGGGMAIAGVWPSVNGADACGEYFPVDDGPFNEGPPDFGDDDAGKGEPRLILSR